MTGRVVHALGNFDYDYYVGRANPRKRFKASPFSNPFKVGLDGGRDEVLKQFDWYARYCASQGDGHLIWRGPKQEPITYHDAVKGLRGKTLACWCADKDRPLTPDDPIVCHGQILLRLAEELHERASGARAGGGGG